MRYQVLFLFLCFECVCVLFCVLFVSLFVWFFNFCRSHLMKSKSTTIQMKAIEQKILFVVVVVVCFVLFCFLFCFYFRANGKHEWNSKQWKGIQRNMGWKATQLTVKKRCIQQRTRPFAKFAHKRVTKQQHINGFLLASVQEIVDDSSMNRASTIAKFVDHL